MDEFEKEFKLDALDEIIDNLSAFNDIVRRLELESDAIFCDVCDELFRLVHNMKGNSKSAGFDTLSSSFHHLESKLIPYRENKTNISANDIAILGSCYSWFSDSLEMLKLNFNHQLDFNYVDEVISKFGAKIGEKLEQEKASDSVIEGQTRVLVVDDEVDIVEIVSDQLSVLFNCRITKAYNGQQAIELCQHAKFDVIITDFSMPCVDGLQLLEHIRNNCDVNKNSAVIFTSGHNPDLCSDKKMWDNTFILNKPFKADKLAFLMKCCLKLNKAA